jgi:alpha-1,6-mannosyltransferase
MRWVHSLRAAFWVSAGLSMLLSAVALKLLWDWSMGPFVVAFGGLMALYGYAGFCVVRGKFHAAGGEASALAAILVVAVLIRAIALFAPQALSTDIYRYVWDGRVQAAHINPYRFIPADPALSALRDESVYPNINRADYAHTIYPPTAQLAFLAIERVSDSVVGMKLGLIAFEALAVACLIALLRRRGLPTTRVLLYAWHPLPIWEFAGTGHVDAIAIAFLSLAFLAASRRAPMWTGVALAAATLVKYYPILAAPALYRRWDWRMPAAFAVTLLLLYAPYLGVGTGVFGFASGYAAEEGLRDGSGIWMLSLLKSLGYAPGKPLLLFAPFVAVLLVAIGLWVLFSAGRAKAARIEQVMLIAGAFTVCVSPHDPWYFTWLVPFLCFRVSASILWLTAACTLMYAMPHPTGLTTQSLIYGPFLGIVILQLALKRPSTHWEILDAPPST